MMTNLRTRILALSIFLVLSVFSSAQTTLATLPQGNYGPVTGQAVPSGGYVIPQTTNFITIATTISAADLADSTKQISVIMEASDDNGATYNHCLSDDGTTTCAGFTWVGGSLNKQGLPQTISPVMVFTCQGLRGLKARLRITLNKTINMGATVTQQ